MVNYLSLYSRKIFNQLENDPSSKDCVEYLEKIRNSKPPYFVTDLNGVTQQVTAEDFSKTITKTISEYSMKIARLTNKKNNTLLKPLDKFLTENNIYTQFYNILFKLSSPINIYKNKNLINRKSNEINSYMLKKVMFELFHEPYKKSKIFYPKKKDYEAFRRGDINPQQHIKNVLIYFGINELIAEDLAPKLFHYYAHELLEIDRDFIEVMYKLQNAGHLVGVITDRLPLAMAAAMAKKNYIDQFMLPIVSSHQVTVENKVNIEKPHELMFKTFFDETTKIFQLAGKLKSGEKLNPHDFVFIDDKEVNLKGSSNLKDRIKGYTGAEGSGMRTILYKGYKTGFKDFLKELNTLGFQF